MVFFCSQHDIQTIKVQLHFLRSKLLLTFALDFKCEKPLLGKNSSNYIRPNMWHVSDPILHLELICRLQEFSFWSFISCVWFLSTADENVSKQNVFLVGNTSAIQNMVKCLGMFKNILNHHSQISHNKISEVVSISTNGRGSRVNALAEV